MRTLGLPWLKRLSPLAPLLLRLAIGAIFVAHGWQKWGSRGSSEFDWFAGSAIPTVFPEPTFWAWVVFLVELVGGLAVILGLLTRLAALLQAVIMLVALFGVKLAQGAGLVGGYELDLILLAACLALAILGGGPIGLDSLLGIDRKGD